MNHKEEAIKRVEEFLIFTTLSQERAKQCALLSIKKEIKIVEWMKMYINDTPEIYLAHDMLKDLIEVKKEIELL